MPDGRGKFTFDNGDTYEGDWQKDQANGFGCLIKKDKKYIGEWKNDNQHGAGQEFLKDGSIF